MQRIITLDGIETQVGLSWSALSSDLGSRKKEIKDYCKETGYNFGVLLTSEEAGVVGLAPKEHKAPSAAAAMAYVNSLSLSGSTVEKSAFAEDGENKNWVIIEPVKGFGDADKQQFWFCAVTGGLPVPGSDIIDDISIIMAKLVETISVFEEVVIYTKSEEVKEWASGADGVSIIDRGFKELFDSIDVSNKKLIKLHPTRQAGVPQIVVITLGTILIGLAGFGVHNYLEEQRKIQIQKEISRKKEMENIQKIELERKKNEETYALSKKKAKEEQENLIKIALRSNAPFMSTIWAESIESIPINHGGWSINLVECDTVSCKVNLTRDDILGSNQSLKEIIPDAVFTEQSAFYIKNLAQNSQEVSLSNLKNWPEFAADTLSQLQQLKSVKINVNVGSRKTLTYTPPPLKSDAGEIVAQAPISLGIAKGTLSIKGSGLWVIGELAEVMKHKELSLQKITFTMGNDITRESEWEINGEYFVKEDDQVQDGYVKK